MFKKTLGVDIRQEQSIFADKVFAVKYFLGVDITEEASVVEKLARSDELMNRVEALKKLQSFDEKHLKNALVPAILLENVNSLDMDPFELIYNYINRKTGNDDFLNASYPSGFSLAHAVSFFQSETGWDRLILKGADINVGASLPDENFEGASKEEGAKAKGITPFHVAVEAGNSDWVKRLLLLPNISIDTNATRGDGRSALFGAIEASKDAIFHSLLNYRQTQINVDLKDNLNITPLQLSIFNKRWEIAKKLIEIGVDVQHKNSYGSDAFLLSWPAGNREIINLLLKKGAKSSTKGLRGHNFVHLFALGAEKDIAIFDINEYAALLAQSAEKAEDFLHNACELTPLHYAVQYGNVNKARAIVDAFKKKKGVIEELINHNKKSDLKETPLFLAAKEGHTSVFEFLLSKKADASIPNAHGATVLEVAKKNGHNKIVKLLQSKKQKLAKDNSKKSKGKKSRKIEENFIEQCVQNQASAPRAPSYSGIVCQKVSSLSPSSCIVEQKSQNCNCSVFRGGENEYERTYIAYYTDDKLEEDCDVDPVSRCHKEDNQYDTFHNWPSQLARLVNRVKIIRDSKDGLLRKYGVLLKSGQCAKIVEGRIESKYFCDEDALLVRDKVDPYQKISKQGAFVMLFNENGEIFHRMFHKSFDQREQEKLSAFG